MRGTDLFLQLKPLAKLILGFLRPTSRHALAVTILTISLSAHALTCQNTFDGSIRYPLTSALLEHYRGEENGREIEVTNQDFTRKIFFYTRYLTEREASRYEVFESDGLLVDASGRPLDSKYSYMFVMDVAGRIFASNEKRVGLFHHSSFLAGRPVAAAGEFFVRDGILIQVSAKSGHYQPSRAHLRQFVRELERRGLEVPPMAKEPFDPS